MKLGLLTDIHGDIVNLRSALDILQAADVEQIVLIGDTFQHGYQVEETCRLLRNAGAAGVWGNHDFGLCHQPAPEIQQRYSAGELAFMSTMRPTLELAGCHFSHVEPWLNPMDPSDLWYYEGLPDEHGKLDRIFAAVPHRILFAGHYHQWLLAKPDGIVPWSGIEPVHLNKGRYFVVIGALCEGRFATFDTTTAELIPHQLSSPE